MKLTGAQIVLECLLEQGIDTVFGYPGGTILNIYDELYKYSDRITHILTAHEQGAAHAADGFARSTGKVGVVFATSGPGATNLVTGIATAYMDSSPIVAITCNVATSLLGRDTFQEIDIAGVTMPITKHNYIVKDIAVLADTIREAFAIAESGRPGPVLIDITKDVTAESFEYTPLSEKDLKKYISKSNCLSKLKSLKISDADIKNVAHLINKSEKPVLYIGGGVVISEAYEQLLTLSETAHIPVVMSLMGRTAFPNKHDLAIGFLGMHGSKAANMAVAKCDLLIAAGTRFSDRVTGDTKKFAGNAKIVHIDIDPAEINKNVHVDISLIGDMKATLKKLNTLVKKNRHKNWLDEIAKWKAVLPKTWKRDDKTLHPKFIYEYVNGKMKSDAIVATDVGQHQMWTSQYYNFEKPRTFLTSGGLGTMGFGLGAAIGAAVANPKKRVVLFTGDGCFRMNCNELATVSHFNVPVITIILDNGTLGMVRQWQNIFYEKRFSQTTLDFAPDFVKLADAYGIAGYRAETPEQFKKAFDAAVASKKPCVIDAVINIDETVLPMIPGGKTVEHLIMDID